jgi:hypothetical protein
MNANPVQKLHGEGIPIGMINTWNFVERKTVPWLVVEPPTPLKK